MPPPLTKNGHRLTGWSGWTLTRTAPHQSRERHSPCLLTPWLTRLWSLGCLTEYATSIRRSSRKCCQWCDGWSPQPRQPRRPRRGDSFGLWPPWGVGRIGRSGRSTPMTSTLAMLKCGRASSTASVPVDGATRHGLLCDASGVLSTLRLGPTSPSRWAARPLACPMTVATKPRSGQSQDCRARRIPRLSCGSSPRRLALDSAARRLSPGRPATCARSETGGSRCR